MNTLPDDMPAEMQGMLDTNVNQLPQSRGYRGSKPWQIKAVKLEANGQCVVTVNTGWNIQFNPHQLDGWLPCVGDSIDPDTQRLVRK